MFRRPAVKIGGDFMVNNFADEKWIPVPVAPYGNAYLVSSAGRIRGVNRVAESEFFIRQIRGVILKGRVRRDGYKTVNLSYKRNRQTFAIHRLVALAFCDNPHNHTEVNHKDGNKLNNHASNLEWVSHKENIQHSILTGLNKSQGADNKQFKGLIVATNLSTGEEQTFCGKKALISAGFDHGSVYAVIAGRVKSHRGHYFKRLPLNHEEAA
ncbi:TPA: NUMOD4 domain-containing protein [Escherichia coli]|uniref:NUMOD4 domain-containing protein n=2 Tax=Escherichia coli TaxID=562 RepID=UPI00201ED6A2|nr:NUMOD4 domain-containing protein [Escherichia coli]UTJ28305.1 NUMOD4 motif-containing HNH endonuclease [Escherichia coli]